MRLEKRVAAIEEKFNPDPNEEARQQELKRELEEARKRVETMRKPDEKLPLCWGKRFESEKDPSTSGKILSIAEELAAARERVKKRCMACSQKEKCEHPHIKGGK